MHQLLFCAIMVVCFCQLTVSDSTAGFDRMGVMKDVLWKTFNDWPSLQRSLTIERGEPSNIIDAMVHETDDFLKQPRKRDMAEFLGGMIESKLRIKIRDGTLEQVAAKLSAYMDVIQDPRRMDWNEFRSEILSIENKALETFG